MGVKTSFVELKVKVSASRFFKAFSTDATKVLPKVSPIKSYEIVEGHSVAPGSVIKINFSEGAPFKYSKSRVDTVDSENNINIKYTLFEGDALGDKLEKIYQELKFEATQDGGSVVKLTSEYHPKGDYEVTEEEIKAGKEQAVGLFKAVEEYLLAHPNV